MYSFIYKIVSNQTNKIYIGSTTQELSKRFCRHKSDYRLQKNKIGSFEVLQYDDARIVMIEEFEDISKEELIFYEQYHFELNEENVCNIRKPYLSKSAREQYLIDYRSSRERKDFVNKKLKQKRQELKLQQVQLAF